MTICIVILNWNGLSDTVECLESLKKQTIFDNLFVLIIENGSKNKEGTVLRDILPNSLVINNEKNIGFTGGNNQGIRYGLANNFDFFLLLNNDTILNDEKLLETLLQNLEKNKNYGGLCPTILYEDGTPWFAGSVLSLWKGWKHLHKIPSSDSHNSILPCGYLTGCCVLFRKEFFLSVGLINEKYFFSVEDVELSLRGLKKGWKFGYVPSVSIIHKDSKSSRSSTKGKYSHNRIYFETRNKLWLYRQYANNFQLIFFLLIRFPVEAIIKVSAYIILQRKEKLKSFVSAIVDGLFLNFY